MGPVTKQVVKRVTTHIEAAGGYVKLCEIKNSVLLISFFEILHIIVLLFAQGHSGRQG